MKKAILTFGLFSMMMILTSFTSGNEIGTNPGTETRKFDIGTNPGTETRRSIAFEIGTNPGTETRKFDIGTNPGTETRR